MIIRSQDKKTIANIDCIDTITIIGEEIRYFYGSENSFGILGYYSTEEKAVKVLDMIQEMYEKTLYNEYGLMATANFYVPPFAFIPPKVFQMPEDSEV